VQRRQPTEEQRVGAIGGSDDERPDVRRAPQHPGSKPPSGHGDQRHAAAVNGHSGGRAGRDLDMPPPDPSAPKRARAPLTARNQDAHRAGSGAIEHEFAAGAIELDRALRASQNGERRA
jgi:hypothetical protein